MDLPAFRARFPEFGSTDDPLITACLAEAALRLNAAAFGANWDAAHGYLAAHILATSPFGTAARLEPGTTTTYQTALTELTRQVVPPLTLASWPQIDP